MVSAAAKKAAAANATSSTSNSTAAKEQFLSSSTNKTTMTVSSSDGNNNSSTSNSLSEKQLQTLSAHAKKTVEDQFSTSPNFEFARRRLNLFPKLDLSELTLGKVLGKGQFGLVSEIAKCTLNDEKFLMKDDVAENGTSTTVEEVEGSFGLLGSKEEHVKAKQEGRNFIAAHCIREDNGCDARYAVKLLNEEHFCNREDFYKGVRDMAIEAHFLAAIEHPNIIKLRGLSVEDFGGKKFFLIMDRLYGTLESKLNEWSIKDRKSSGIKTLVSKSAKQKKKMFLKERLGFALDLTSAIMFLHQHCMMDRDLKPENIGFDVRGDLKLFDFGLSREFNPKDERPFPNMTGKTGSMMYMAPEIYYEEAYDESVDIYSFGIILWQMVALDRLYPNFTMRMLEDHVMGKGLRPKLDPSWPDSLCRLMKNSWSKLPTDRPAARQLNILLKREISTLGGDESDMEQNLARRRSTFVQRRFTSMKNVNKRESIKRANTN